MFYNIYIDIFLCIKVIFFHDLIFVFFSWFFFYWHASDIFPCQYVWLYLLHGYVVFCCGNLSLINYLSLAVFDTECSNYCKIALISHTSKVMFKILQARLQLYVNHELPDVQAGFRKGRGTRDQTSDIRWIIKKAREFQKKSTFPLLTTPKPLTVWITTNCGKFFKRWEYQNTSPASWEICMQVKKQQL